MIEISEMIKQMLEKKAEERRLIEENSGYMVQYLFCGHAREIGWNEFDLVEKAKNHKALDAVTRPSSECPFCNQK